MSLDTWLDATPLPAPPPLGDRGVHLWCAAQDQPPLAPGRLHAVLSAQERATAQRYVFERDRTRSVASRGLLRWLLGAYLGLPPDRVVLRLGAHGKPALATADDANALCFNVAHSGGMAVYALTRGREVGVDVEHVRPLPDAAQIAAHTFAASEVSVLLGLPEARRIEAFYVCWTRKEAYVKARGVGLALPLDQFEVNLDRAEGSDRLRVPADPDQGAAWSLPSLSPLPAYLGALAVPERDLSIACYRWAPDGAV